MAAHAERLHGDGLKTFSGMQGRMPGSFSGTMSGDEMTFTMDMPMASMMSSGCTAPHHPGQVQRDLLADW